MVVLSYFRSIIHLLVLSIFIVLSANQLHAGSYQIFNSHYAWVNNWNDPTQLIQGKFSNGNAPGMEIKFNIKDKGLYGYPAILRGSHYGWNPTEDRLFPLQVSTVNNIPVKFSYSLAGNNISGDFAYDIFLRHESDSGNPQLEIMIWGDHNSWPLGQKTGSNVISQNGYDFDLWEGYNASAGYYVYTFVPTNTVGIQRSLPIKGNLCLDIKPFLSWLNTARSQDNYYNNSMYIDAIEAGFEVVNGEGVIKMKATINANK